MAWTELGTIDQYGYEHGCKLSHHLSGKLRGLEGRIDALLGHGWRQIVVVTDHGWLLLPGGLPKVELPQHLTVLRKGRCAVLKEGAQTDQHTVPWHWDKDVRIAVASGIACYETDNEYEHGGISPQECFERVVRRDGDVTDDPVLRGRARGVTEGVGGLKAFARQHRTDLHGKSAALDAPGRREPNFGSAIPRIASYATCSTAAYTRTTHSPTTPNLVPIRANTRLAIDPW